MSSDLAGLVARLEKVADRLEQAGGSPAVASSSSTGGYSAGSGNASLDGFDEILNGSFKTFTEKGQALGAEVAAIVPVVERAFQAQRAFLDVATKAKQPGQDVLVQLLKPTSDAIQEIVSFRESNRRSDQFNHLSALSEGIPALGWVTVAPKPAPFCKEMKDAAQFYVNRVLKDFKDKDQAQCDFVKAWVAVLEELAAFIKKVHTTGLVWNKSGVEASTLVGAAAPAAAPKPAAAAPKPTAAASKPAGDARGGLFAALNKGGAVTSGLKKVDRSQMTHKNPELRAGSKVSADAITAKPKAAPAKKFGGDVKPKDPVFELSGKKWMVEHQKNNSAPLVIDNTEVKQTVYIYKCENMTVQIKGKINSITVDACKKVAVVFDDLVSAFEVVNCQRMQVQVTGKVNTVSIDKTDGIQVYLSQASIDAQIVSAKSSEMNISVPCGADGDFVEFPVPEQYKTVFQDGKLVTEPTDIAG